MACESFSGEGLKRILSEMFGLGDVELVPMNVVCSSQVYRGVSADGRTWFIKSSPAVGRTAVEFFSRHAGHPLLQQPLAFLSVPYGNRWVSVFEYHEMRHVRIEDMSDAQFASFCDGCEEVFGLMRSDGDLSAHRDYSACMGRMSSALSGLGAVSILFASITSMVKSDFEYGAGVETQLIHDDFSYRNYAFVGDELSAILDFDLLDTGSPVEPLASTIIQSIRKARVWYNPRLRNRICNRLRKLQSRFRRDPEEWRVAVNRIRIRDAEYFLLSHERIGWRSAFSFFKRDRRLRWLLKQL